MWKMLWPMLVVVASNTLYNISSKSTPPGIDPFASLFISYLVAAASTLVMFFLTAEQKGLFAELSKANWTTYALGVAIVGLEYGFINVYRAGWKISIAHLFASIALACVLLLVGLLLYKEALRPRQLIGLVVCGAGLVLLGN